MWNNVQRLASSDTNVLKFVFEKDNAVAESVLYKYPTYEDRTVICCSTMSGCPIGCRFCGAGDNFARVLTADEIVSQPLYLFQSEGIDPCEIDKLQIMFMSMGEPLLNTAQLILAIRELNSLFPDAALLVSTSAPKVDYSSFIEASKDISKIGLQFSVHESTDEARNALIPFKAKLNLQEIAKEGERWATATQRRPYFNYCAHDGNTTDKDADRILALFNPEIWEATISVICERDESVAAANKRQEMLAWDFQQKLNARGFSTRMFNPVGQDTIGGGCGQLWFVQEWMRKHPDLVRPTAGRGLPVVHTPREQ